MCENIHAVRQMWSICLFGVLVLLWISPTALVAQSAPILDVSPNELAFEAEEGGSAPTPQTLTISNGGQGQMDWETTDNADWLIAESSGVLSGGQSTEINVIALVQDLDSGTHEATITVIAEGAENSPVDVDVTLEIERTGPIKVPDDVSTLEDAVDQAQDGGVIELAAGTHRIVSMTITKSLTIRGARAAKQVIVQGDGEHRALIVEGSNVQVTLQSVTISNGLIGLQVEQTSQVTVKDSVIAENTSAEITTFDSARLTIQNSTIRDTAPASEGTQGPGLAIHENSEATIIDNAISGNSSIGVFVRQNAEATIRDNTIENTQPDEEGNFGFGIDVVNSATVIIDNNRISSNRNDGIVLAGDVDATVNANRINDNGEDGIHVGGNSENESISAEISGNTILDNADCGVFIDDDTGITVDGRANQVSGNHPDICDPGDKLPEGFEK